MKTRDPYPGYGEVTARYSEALAGLDAVRAQVLGQVIDPGGQERDLDFGRAGILVVSFIGCDDFGFSNCGGHGFVVWFTTVGPPGGDRAARPDATEVAPEPASPFQSGGVPDQSWWRPATDGLPLTQVAKLPQRAGGSKRKFGAEMGWSETIGSGSRRSISPSRFTRVTSNLPNRMSSGCVEAGESSGGWETAAPFSRRGY